MKPQKLLQNIMKPFKFNSRTDHSSREEDIEKIAAQEQKQFSYETLSRATDKFHANRKLGEGGFGPVFKGKLDDGREIAVKKLSRSSRQGKKEFQNEAKLLARVQHRNAVNLLGYCAFGDEKLLVYEYVCRESLDKFLFKADRRQELDWKKRYDIIIGVAKGLLYLHEHAHCCIIHRDIKASNILLDEKWVPKIADFGMARLFPEDQTHVNTRIAGTNGYMAPEYVMHGHLSTKADVFSFGVLMLELVSGQRNSSSFNNPNLDAENLLDWAFKLLKKDGSLELIDEMIAPTAIAEQVALCVRLGLLCVQSDPQLRPAMSKVVTLLSKRPTTMTSMEEPTRPGTAGTRYRRSRPQQQQKKQQQHQYRGGGGEGSSSHAGSSGASSTVKTESTSAISTMTTTTNYTNSRGGITSDPHGKRPLTIE